MARYTDVWNRHRKFEIHSIHEIGSATKLYYLWVKGHSTWGERETQSFYADCFWICSNPRAAPHLQTTSLTAAGPESQPSLSDAGTRQTAFLKSPKSSALSGMMSFTSSGPISYRGIFILTSVNDTTSPRALMLHHTNPCTKRKVLILTKPKGKIYKTRSLRNYIT